MCRSQAADAALTSNPSGQQASKGEKRMARKLCVLVAFLILAAGTASAQDVRTVLQNSMRAMGGADLKTLQYTANGWFSRIGQTYGLAEDWPHYLVTNYTRQIDYDAKSSREDYTQSQGNYPVLGRVPMAEERVTTILRGGYAWNLQADRPVPLTRPYLDGIPYNDYRLLELVLTPHGFLRAAMAATDATAITLPIVGPSDFGLSQNGRKVTIVSFTTLGGKYKVNGTINDQNLVELVDTWIPNPVYGDMDYEMRYTQYRDYNGVKFPGIIHVHQGDPRLNPAHNYYELRVTDVKPNASVPAIPVPEAVRTATAPPVRVESTKLAEGVWMLGGGTHNSMLVEFKDFVAIVEAPVNEERSLAVIAEAERLAPGKLIRYVINTHHHFDHAGGLRTYLSQGTTIVTHESNKQYYLDILFHPGGWELQPDRLARYNPMYMISRRPAPIEAVGKKYVVSDGARELQILQVQDVAYGLGDPSYRQGNHSADMLMAYLPKERILFNSDLFSPPAQGAPPATPTPGMRTLYQNILLQKLDVAQHVPGHGRVGTNEDLLKIVGTTASSRN
jgi:glyoxylase-like metal-dependent hydrolase (beta-lactamase superfamily II)